MSGTVPTRYFQVLDSRNGLPDGHHMMATTQTAAIYNGYIAAIDSAGYAHLYDGTEDSYGLFYDFMAMEEYPTSDNLTTYLTGEYVTVMGGGPFRALVGTHAFAAGTLPAANTLLCAGSTGLITTTGTCIIGRCVTNSVGISGTDKYVSECIFTFPSLVA